MTPTRQLFVEKRLRCTNQRIAIFETLCNCTSHPTAEELFGMVKPSMSSLSLATVYNTLESLCEAGLAMKLPTHKGTCRYDADTSDHLHIRFQDTGEIQDVPLNLSKKLMDQLPKSVLIEIERALGVSIDGISVQLRGRKIDKTS